MYFSCTKRKNVQDVDERDAEHPAIASTVDDQCAERGACDRTAHVDPHEVHWESAHEDLHESDGLDRETDGFHPQILCWCHSSSSSKCVRLDERCL